MKKKNSISYFPSSPSSTNPNNPTSPISLISPVITPEIKGAQEQEKYKDWGGFLWISLLLGIFGILLFISVVPVPKENAPSSPSPSANFNQALKGQQVRYRPIDRPSISFTVWKEFLVEMKSPAQPEADTMYKACLEEGCDPAVAAAFFEHESLGGTLGVATITKSLGNIRCTNGYECYKTPGNGSFRRYSSWAEGLKDWARLLKGPVYAGRGLLEIEQIIPVYAPSSDRNNEGAYISAVKSRVDDLRRREGSN